MRGAPHSRTGARKLAPLAERACGGMACRFARRPEGRPRATRAVGARQCGAWRHRRARRAQSAAAVSRLRQTPAGSPVRGWCGATQARGGGQALSGDAAGRGQARDERGFQTIRAKRLISKPRGGRLGAAGLSAGRVTAQGARASGGLAALAHGLRLARGGCCAAFLAPRRDAASLQAARCGRMVASSRRCAGRGRRAGAGCARRSLTQSSEATCSAASRPAARFARNPWLHRSS